MASAYRRTTSPPTTTLPPNTTSSTSSSSDPVAPSQSAGGAGGAGAVTAAPMTVLDVLAVIYGNSPMDVILGKVSSDVSALSTQFGDPTSTEAYGPTGTTVGNAVKNNLYQTPGMYQYKLSRGNTTGPIVQPGRTIDPSEYVVDTSTLPNELKNKGTDVKTMTDAGWVAYVQPGQNGGPGKLRWVHKAQTGQQTESQTKDGFYRQEGFAVDGKVVSANAPAGNATIGTVTATATPVQLLTALFQLPTDQLIQFQHKMWDGGYFQGTSRPTWGQIDDATISAYNAAMKDSLTHPTLTLDESIAAAGNQSMATRTAARKAKEAEAVASAGGGANPVSVMSEDEVAKIVGDTSEQLLGYRIGGDEVKTMTAKIRERQTAEGQANADVAANNAKKAAGVVPDADVDRFLNLFAVPNAERFPNVVGHLGMRPREWPSWLAKLGMDPTTPFTPDNERKVMKDLALDYYDQFGNWHDVATAILSGPGAGWADISHGLAPTQPGQGFGSSINDQANRITNGFTAGGGDTTAKTDAATASATGQVVPVESFSAQAFTEAELKRQHPEQYFGNSFVDRASDFMTMLGPTVPQAGQTT